MHELGIGGASRKAALAHAPIGEFGTQTRVGFQVAVVRSRSPFLGVHDARAREPRGSVRGLAHGAAGELRRRARLGHDGRRQRVALRTQDHDLHAPHRRHVQGGGGHGERQRFRMVNPVQHELCAARHGQFIQRAPVGKRLAGVIDGRLEIDQRLVAQVVEHAEQVLVQVVGEVLALGERAHTERVAIGRECGNAFANVLGGGAVHDRVAPGLELPGSLSGRDHEGAAAEARHPGLERSQGAQGRIEKDETEDLAGERLRLRMILQRLREREQVEDLLAREIRQIEEAFHAGILASASQSRSTWLSFRI